MVYQGENRSSMQKQQSVPKPSTLHEEDPVLVSGSLECPSWNYILSMIPPRPLVDLLVARYFNSKHPSLGTIPTINGRHNQINAVVALFHPPTFQREVSSSFSCLACS